MKLYHGTTETVLRKALVEGLRPRGKEQGNWNHTVSSNANTVYLTVAYAPYFAHSACTGKENAAVLEIDTDFLDPGNLVCDEDALEQAFRGKDELPKEWDMKKRTLWYRQRADQWHFMGSIKALGNCGHRGRIPPEAVTRALVISHESMVKLIMQYGLDPQISVQAFRVIGHKYTTSLPWLFGDERWEYNPEVHLPEGVNLEVYKNGPTEAAVPSKANLTAKQAINAA